MIVRDPNKPFYVLPTDIIDQSLSLEAVAVYSFIARHGSADVDRIASHFGIRSYHVETAMRELADRKFIDIVQKGARGELNNEKQ